MERLLNKYQTIIFVDIETSGLDTQKDKIIKLSTYQMNNDKKYATMNNDLIKRSDFVFKKSIEGYIGIKKSDLEENGISLDKYIKRLNYIFNGQSLLIFYNATFVLDFVKEELKHYSSIKGKINYIDLYDIFKIEITSDMLKKTH